MTTETGLTATGLLKEVRIGAETTWGTASVATGQKLRRVSSTLSVKKSTYKSNEIQPDGQIHDFRHGQLTVDGQLSAELTPLTYEPVFAQLLRGTFGSGGSSSGATVTSVAATTGNAATFTRSDSMGSWITDGHKVGDVVRFTGFTSGSAANNARNYRITALTVTVMTVGPAPSTTFPSVGNEAVVAVSGATGIGCALVGKKLITPAAGSLVDQSFSLEHWYSDIAESELFTGCRATRAQLSLPPTGLARCDFTIAGKTVITAGSAAFASPTAVTTDAAVASIDGIVRVNGTDYAMVSGLTISIAVPQSPEAVIGSNLTPYLFPGIQDISGSLTALFIDESLSTVFLNESEISLLATLYLTSAVNSDFISFNLPRIKLNSNPADDKPGAIARTYSFQAMNQIAGGAATAYDATTIAIQDSLAT